MTYADVLRPADRSRALAYDAILILGGSLLVALFAQIEIPMFPVPITGQTFAVLLVGALLGSKRGALAMLLYLGMGAAGAPVLAGAAGGMDRVMGPTGGYLIGFIAAAFVVGWLAERGWDRNIHTTAAAMLIGNLIIYAFGLIWLPIALNTLFGTQMTFMETLQAGMIPFLIGDAIKLVLAALLLPMGWRLIGRSETPSS